MMKSVISNSRLHHFFFLKYIVSKKKNFICYFEYIEDCNRIEYIFFEMLMVQLLNSVDFNTILMLFNFQENTTIVVFMVAK
jgi:hypothetical protein